MKKLLLVLGMITCILGLTACGSKAEEPAAEQLVSEDDAIAYADSELNGIIAIVQQGMEAQYAGDAVYSAAFESWKSAQEDMGNYQAIIDHEVEITEDMITVNVTVDGSVRDAKVEFVLEKDDATQQYAPTSITTNVQYSFGELMQKAFLNTVIGMGTVFIVLILISAIISAFVLIPKIQAAFSKKNKQPEEVKKEAVDNTITQVIESEEELSDDLELVAVIAAAIAASEGAASADGFVVRSIRRANTNKWRNA